MKKDKAIHSAQWCANKYRETYVIIKTRNGQWMCERKAFADKHYPKEAERIVFKPEHLDYEI